MLPGQKAVKVNLNVFIVVRNMLLVCVCVCVYVCVCVCLRPSTVKVSSVWGWNSNGQINNIVLKTFLSSTTFLHRYFSMKHQSFLTSCFILFAHQKRAKPRLNQLDVRLAFKTWGLHSPLSGVTFGPHYIVSRCAFGVCTHKRRCNLTMKG